MGYLTTAQKVNSILVEVTRQHCKKLSAAKKMLHPVEHRVYPTQTLGLPYPNLRFTLPLVDVAEIF